VLTRLVNVKVSVIANKLSPPLFEYQHLTVLLAMKYRGYFFWLEILIKTTDTLRQAATSTCASCYRGARP